VRQVLGAALGSWANTTVPNIKGGIEDEGVTIPSFLHNFLSPLDAEKIKQYATSLEDHTLGQHINEFCREAKLVGRDSNITIDDPIMDISRHDLHHYHLKKKFKIGVELYHFVNSIFILFFDYKTWMKSSILDVKVQEYN